MNPATSDNTRVQDELVARLPDVIPGFRHRGVGAIQYNVFSAIFRVDEAANGRGVYVKIPKADLRVTGPAILPLSAADRCLGRAEYESLRYLEDNWDGAGVDVRFVRPLGYIEDFNAVVIERVDAQDGLSRFRSLALRERLVGAGRIFEFMRRLATALRRFHDRTARADLLDVDAVHVKIASYAERLAALTTVSAVCADVARWARARNPRPAAPALSTLTLKGIDIRNVLIDAADGLYLLDPGRMKRAPAEAGLARFLVTWRILYWGHPAFVAGLTPSARTEDSLLAAYGPIDNRTFDLMMLKELLKHWHTAYVSLGFRPWHGWRRRLTAQLYVDRFYGAQVKAGLHRVAES